MEKMLIINADDLGFTKNINLAIKNAHLTGYLTHCSVMTNTVFFDHAVQNVIGPCPNLKVGVHVNLTCGTALTGSSDLAKTGKLRHTFISLLFQRKNRKFLDAVEKEIDHQIQKAKMICPEISHIDGHEHVHIIPSINKIVRKLAKENGIPRVREINESLQESLRFNYRGMPFSNLIKLTVLKFLSMFNKKSNSIEFYSILNTCMINERNLFPYLKNSDAKSIEIMVHPALDFDEEEGSGLEGRFIKFLKSPWRQEEYKLCFNKKFEDYVREN